MITTVEDIDLARLTELVRARLGDTIDASYLRGKTVVRDAIVEALDCSEVQAEELVETLELQGFIRFPQLADDTHPAGRQPWIIGRRSS
jgi:hypothetical protein